MLPIISYIFKCHDNLSLSILIKVVFQQFCPPVSALRNFSTYIKSSNINDRLHQSYAHIFYVLNFIRKTKKNACIFIKGLKFGE